MKRNLFPFLGIAFVVAIAATGVFYGLFVGKISGAAPAASGNASGTVVLARAVDRGVVITAADVRLVPSNAQRPEGAFGNVADVVGRTVSKSLTENEPLTDAVLTGSKAGRGLSIPKGMRAISVRASDSTGLLPYLRAGNHVDVQSVSTLGNGEAVVRTLLSNVEVLNVHAGDTAQSNAATVLNLLVPAKDVERVALADSTAKVRIVLRNADDRDEVPVAAPTVPAGAKIAAVVPAGPRVSFQVRMAAVAAEAVREFTDRAGMAAAGAGAVRIGVLPADWKAEDLERGKSVQLLSSESVDSSQWQEVSLQAGGSRPNEYDLRLRLTPRGAWNGKLNVRVRPELTLPQRGGVSSRRFSADLNVAEGQSVLVAGFERDASAPMLIEKLFQSPAVKAPGRELLLVVTPRVAAR